MINDAPTPFTNCSEIKSGPCFRSVWPCQVTHPGPMGTWRTWNSIAPSCRHLTKDRQQQQQHRRGHANPSRNFLRANPQRANCWSEEVLAMPRCYLMREFSMMKRDKKGMEIFTVRQWNKIRKWLAKWKKKQSRYRVKKPAFKDELLMVAYIKKKTKRCQNLKFCLKIALDQTALTLVLMKSILKFWSEM